MKKYTVGVFFGGRSAEHRISLKSAHTVLNALDPEKYEPVMVGITKEGAWLHFEGSYDEVLNDTWEQGKCTPVILPPDRSVHGLVEWDGNVRKVTRLDVIFPVLHGKNGEDGTIQGLMELAGIPYVGCGVLSSALCMDKDVAHKVAGAAGIAVPKFLAFTAPVTPAELSHAATELAFPVFVKPANCGSSFGVNKVETPAALQAAVDDALRFDRKVCIEEAVPGCEVGCAVLGYDKDLRVGEVDQICLTHGFFRIHQEAHPETTSENSTVLVPADVPDEIRDRIQDTAKAVYRALQCGGLARVDMFLTPENQVVFNEVNSLPGFTSYSRYPRMMVAAGHSIASIVDEVITLALARAQA